MPDISFDEQYMGYYDDDGNWVTPSDPRDDEGYKAWHDFYDGPNAKKLTNRRWRSENRAAIYRRETLPVILGCLVIFYFWK